MRKTTMCLTICFSLYCSLSSASEDRVVERAKGFCEIERKNHAVKILENYIDYEPKDYEAYMLLGSLYIELPDYRSNLGLPISIYKYALKASPSKKKDLIMELKMIFEGYLEKDEDLAYRTALILIDIDPSSTSEISDIYVKWIAKKAPPDWYFYAIEFAPDRSAKDLLKKQCFSIPGNPCLALK